MWQKVEVKGRRKLLVLKRNISLPGKCWPRGRELLPAWLGVGTWGMSQLGAVVGWRSWGVTPFHPTAPGVSRQQYFAGGKKQSPVKVLLGEGPGCGGCRVPGAAV